MPPKPRGRAGRGRGRGGAARGASSTAAGSGSDPQQSAADVDVINVASTPTPAAPTSAAPTSATSTSVASTPSDYHSAAATPASTSSAPVPAAKKHKPKAIRTSEQERARRAEEIDRQEALRLGQEARRLSRLRGRGGRGRGRGNLMGRSLRSAPALGPLSSGTYSFNGEGSSGTGQYGVASGSRFSSSIKGEGKRSGYFKDTRINTDTLYDHSNPYSYDPGTGDKKNPILPLGIRRIERKDGATTKTKAEDGEGNEEHSDEEGLFVDDGNGGNSQNGSYQAANNVRIKKEGAEDSMDVDMSQIPEDEGAPKPLPVERKKLPQARGPLTPKEIEDDLHAKDLEKMMHVLSLSQQQLPAQEEPEARPRTMLDGHMFHFQFPPSLPRLKPVSNRPVKIKPEVDDDDDLVMLDQSRSSKDKGKAPADRIDLTQDKDVKMESSDGEEESDDEDELGPSGYVGKLIVRKSGKVELDWGGHRMEVGMGIEKSFFTSAVLIDHEEAKAENGSASPSAQDSAGTAYSMGKVQGTFTVASMPKPTKPWVVDPKDLEIPTQD